ncbi:MAG: ABC transporter ATP-binding protein [Sandaracinaceae bacterium]
MSPDDEPGRHAPLIELAGVERVYGAGEAEVRALDGVDLIIEPGELVAIMGASGSGKSTVMNVIGCLDTPTAGSYRFRGIPVETLDGDRRALLRRRYLGFIFQGFNLLPRTSALENVELPLVYRAVGAQERRVRAAAALDRVGLGDRLRHTPAELSGGQQQRVAIARAIVSDPEVILADEPTGNLDSRTSRSILEMLTELNRDRGMTVVMVTHEAEMAAYFERTVRFVDGRIVEDLRRRTGEAA